MRISDWSSDVCSSDLFTNKSAKEMRERVAKRIRCDGAEGLTVCTFHALGLKLLQIEHAKAGLRRGFSIFDPDDTENQLKDLLPGAKPYPVQDRTRIRLTSTHQYYSTIPTTYSSH